MEPNKTPEREETSEPLEPITTASFQRKAVSIAELPDSAAFTARERFVVVKVIELTADQYRYFTDHLMDDTLPFIKENTRLTDCDRDGRTKALMITTPGRNGCLLVNTGGTTTQDMPPMLLRRGALTRGASPWNVWSRRRGMQAGRLLRTVFAVPDRAGDAL